MEVTEMADYPKTKERKERLFKTRTKNQIASSIPVLGKKNVDKGEYRLADGSIIAKDGSGYQRYVEDRYTNAWSDSYYFSTYKSAYEYAKKIHDKIVNMEYEQEKAAKEMGYSR
jgi:hypothetical protein